jgi:O-antigen ligase
LVIVWNKENVGALNNININIKKVFGVPDTGISEGRLWLFAGLGLFVLMSCLLAFGTDQLLLLGLPAGLLLGYQTLVDYRKVFYLLMAMLPLSTEYYFPNGFGTDLPTEPLVVGLMFVYIMYMIMNWRSMKKDFLLHPITLFLFVHLGWMAVATIFSELFVVSFKFMLAKIWYVVGYFFLAGSLLKRERDVKTLFWVIFIPFILIVAVTVVRHATYSFGFEEVKLVMRPCFRNHVLYASIMAIFLPFIVLAATWYPKKSYLRWGLIGSVLFFLVAIYLSYTRTAYISLVLAAGSYFIIRWRLMKWASLATAIGIVLGSLYMVQQNHYLDYAPDFEKTISHQNFDDLVSATAKGQDVSTMERVYRWVAGMQMSKEQLLTGYGPGNFYNFYQRYAVTSFETYVSDNPEKSGIHCYYLMMLTDQGIPGAIIFLAFSFFVLIKGERIYHETRRTSRKRLVMALLLSQIIIDAFLIINDMVETDKVGAFFFMNMALLINMDLLNRREAKSERQLDGE